MDQVQGTRGSSLPRGGAQGGLTFAELILSIALLGVIIVCVLGVFSKLMTASTKSANQTEGLLFAQRRLDQAQRLGPADWGTEIAVGVYSESASQSQGVYFNDRTSGTEYYYLFSAERVPTAQNAMGDLYRLRVDVTWWAETQAEKDQALAGNARRGSGSHSLTLTRLHYLQNPK